MEEYGFGDYSYAEPETSPIESGGMFSDFFGAAQERLGSVLPSGTDDGPSVGSQVFEAIYQYGRGKIDVAREKAVGAFLMTSEGKKTQREGIMQTLTQYAPMIALVVVGIFLLGHFARR